MARFLTGQNVVDVSAMFGIRVTDPEGKLVWKQSATPDDLVALAELCVKKAGKGELPAFHLRLAERCISVVFELQGLKRCTQAAEMEGTT